MGGFFVGMHISPSHPQLPWLKLDISIAQARQPQSTRVSPPTSITDILLHPFPTLPLNNLLETQPNKQTTARMLFSTLAVAALSAVASAKTIRVDVGKSGLSFSPNDIKADKGDVLGILTNTPSFCPLFKSSSTNNAFPRVPLPRH